MSVSAEEIFNQIGKALPDAGVTYCENPSPSAQHSILVDSDSLVNVLTFLRDTDGLEFDFLSNLSGVDWPKPEIAEKVTVIQPVSKESSEPEEDDKSPSSEGFLEVVYHLYSVSRKEGPLVLRARTQNRGDKNAVASVTPVFRSAEFQEREAYDLFGIQFAGHPDLRRILMWDEFEDHPMRKDYVNPDDYEYEPTPHANVLARAEAHYPKPESDEAQDQN